MINICDLSSSSTGCICLNLMIKLGLKKWIADSFSADGGRSTVSGNHSRFVRESQQAFLYGRDNLSRITPRKVCSADRASEERVSGDEQFVRGKVNADAAFGVSGRVQDYPR